MAKKSILITGASSGFGKLTSEAFADAGWLTFGAMRNVMAAGERPLRSVIPPNVPVEAINAGHAPIQRGLVASLGVPELLARS